MKQRTYYVVKETDILLLEEIGDKIKTEVVMAKAGARAKCFEIANSLNTAMLLGMQLAMSDRNIEQVIKKALQEAKEKES